MAITPVNIRTGASIAAASPTQNNPATITRANIVGNARAQSLVNVESPAGATNRFVFPSNLGPHYMNIGISTSSRTSSMSIFGGLKNDIQNTETSIALPLPENIRDITQIAYSEGPVLGGANALQAATGAISGGIAGGVGTRLIGRPGAGGGLQGAVGALRGATGGLFVPALNEIISRTGLTPNQMLTVLLQGPTYKTHSFTWKLYPRDARESATIKNIVNELKIKSRPGTALGRQFFTFPRLFNLSFTINGKEHFNENDPVNYLFAFKPAVLEGITVNYTPSGQPALYKGTGAPDGVELTLNFKEVEYWLNDNESLSATEDRLLGPGAQQFIADVGALAAAAATGGAPPPAST